jgi:hypothetical protein
MVGTATMLSPKLRAKAEAKAESNFKMQEAEKRSKNLEALVNAGKDSEELEKAGNIDPRYAEHQISGEDKDIAKATLLAEASEELVNIRKLQLSGKSPTVESFRDYEWATAQAQAAKNQVKDLRDKKVERIKQEREAAEKAAQAELAARQEEMRPKQQRRSFKNVQVDFGDGSFGTVGDLPKSWQKQVSEQLKPEQRKKLIAQTEPKKEKK